MHKPETECSLVKKIYIVISRQQLVNIKVYIRSVYY